MKILVTSLTEHRIDIQLAEWMLAGLALNSIEGTNNIEDEDIGMCIMFNGVLNEAGSDKINYLRDNKIPIHYMHDDCDIELPAGLTTVVSQFTNFGHVYFPIAELAVLHHLWDAPLINNKKFDLFYGGSFKSRRDYNSIPNRDSTLLVGNDDGWGAWAHVTRLGTIKDMKMLYQIMSMCRTTRIVSDPKHDNINMPLRAFEGVFTNCDVIWPDGTYTPPSIMKVLYTKEKTLRLIKELVCRLQQM